eukprot:6483305-Amphidinium_carterae.1
MQNTGTEGTMVLGQTTQRNKGFRSWGHDVTLTVHGFVTLWSGCASLWSAVDILQKDMSRLALSKKSPVMMKAFLHPSCRYTEVALKDMCKLQ